MLVQSYSHSADARARQTHPEILARPSPVLAPPSVDLQRRLSTRLRGGVRCWRRRLWLWLARHEGGDVCGDSGAPPLAHGVQEAHEDGVVQALFDGL